MDHSKIKRYATLAFLILLVGPVFGRAEVFKWLDAAGKVHYSDRGQGAAQRVNIRSEYTFTGLQKIYDGDTVLLQDGRKVRLLGINTPEIAHRGNPAEAGGEEAKAWLENYLRGKKVRLQGDAEKQDKYGRVLAHLFTENGEHVNLELVKQGLAAVTIHPPNLLYADALFAAERQAEMRRLGIWNRPAYAAKTPVVLNADNSRGWQRIIGHVGSVHRSRKYAYLEFSSQVAARIALTDLPVFGDLNGYLGKTAEVRGWLFHAQGRYILPLYHPSAIVVRP